MVFQWNNDSVCACTTVDISLHRNRGIIDRKVVAQGKLLGVVRTIQETREGKRQGQGSTNEEIRDFSSFPLARAAPLPSSSSSTSAFPRSSFIFPGHVESFLFRSRRVHPRSSRRACARRTGRQQRFTSRL